MNDEDMLMDSPKCCELLLQSHERQRNESDDEPDEKLIKEEVYNELLNMYNQ
jgi:hypothetical protein